MSDKVLDYSPEAMNDPKCPTCGEAATARLGERPGRDVAEFWDSNAHCWFVRLPAAPSTDTTEEGR